MPMKKGYKALVDEAMAEVETLSVDQAAEAAGRDDTQLVDIRDVRELNREGRIPGALHAPRGMLEFWIDPESPYHKEVFASGKKLIFFCAGGLRSALATKTAQDMGLENVAHIEGGFGAWRKAGKPVQAPETAPGEAGKK
ncbi:rhodanese-like domain-containing protein [Marinibaculum pumilum]|uniref:Rhodanese-like domain-containing protein n=1 Tax=Marinibaculum pumilum TaxID=1766165 RepID=A0ABV7KVK9_9PROT